MPRWGMVIDLDKCTGCGTCAAVCRQENNVPVVGSAQAGEKRAIYWMELVPLEGGEDHGGIQKVAPRPCMQCDNPPCTKVCPVRATYKNPEGLVAQVYPRCIGCRYCTNNCPYSAKFFNWYEPSWSKGQKRALNPDVSVREKGVVEKCSFCHHRLIKARERARMEKRELAPDDYIPACMETCPAEAISFGDLDDPHSQVAELATSKRAFRQLEELGTEPKVYYLSEGE